MSDKQFSVYDKEAMTFKRMAVYICICTLPIDMYVFIYVYK